MKTELVPRYVGDILPFSLATCDHLEKPGRKEVSGTTYGQVFKDGLLAWLANGPSLEVVSAKNGERHGTWEFGADYPDASIKITCVTEIKESQGSRLIVGTDNGKTGGFVCLFNINTSKIMKVIAVPQKVTSLDMISPVGGVNPYNFLLCQELRYMYGILAVGMQDGGIFLIDLMLDDSSYSDEFDPRELAFFSKQAHNVPNVRKDALACGKHLTFHLNGGCQSKHRFLFLTPANEVSTSLLVDEVYVSALMYTRPNGCLITGFSFGGFQIWDLNKLQLMHTSDYKPHCPPVIRLCFQEPDNDPRNFCYLWVVRGQPMTELKQEELAAAALYSLSFEKKVHTEGFGQCYQELISCVPRFDFDLNHDPMLLPSNDKVASRLISCMTIEESATRSQSEHQQLANISLRDEGNGCSLCLFVWESTFVGHNKRSQATLAIFDLNQWYQAQMPAKLRYSSMKLCPYFGFYSLCRITEKGLPDFLLDVYIPSQSIRRMHTNSKTEQFFYPNSLAFDTISLFDTGVIHAPFLGLQRQVMLELKKIGPSILVNPNDAFQICLCCNLLPLHGEPQTSNVSLNGQRESLLSMALEYEMIDFLISTIKEWASGQYTIEGCTLRFIQEWAWKRVYHIKMSLDKQCVSLFDCSGLHLDTLTVQSLYHQVGQLKNLELIFRTLFNQCQAIPTTDYGAKELEHRGNVISFLVLYLEVILWFLNYGLLPENDEDDDSGSVGIAYPIKQLSCIYSKRRTEIHKISSTIGPKDVLFIDGLLTHADDSLSSLWERNGGDGLYPPPNLYALLNSYLLPNVSSTVKHQIVQYLFLDLSELLDSEHYASVVEHLVKFPAAFSLSPSCIKLTQGFWLLDHKDFEEAILTLLHPMINASDICSWQHSRVMKAFLYQGEPKKALTYARVRKPSLKTAEDVCFHLTLLLANGLVAEAYQYQKSIRNQGNAEDLLQHFFLGCQQTKNFRDLLNLPLSPLEECHLVGFLNNCPEPQAREILVIYYLQRSRYVDAMQLNERLIPRVMHDADPAARERAITRNAIVDGFSNLLPQVYGQITQSAKHLFGPKKDIWLKVPRPQPLSTKVIAHSKEPMSQSNLIETIMSQITSVWSMPPKDYTPFRGKFSSKTDHKPNIVPFIGSPVSTKKSLKYEDQLTQPVFPTIVGRDDSGLDQSLYHASPAKKARFLDVNPLHLSPCGRRRSLNYYNSEALSLLQTPPVRRKTPSARESAVKIGPPNFTPQSILKSHLKTKPSTSASVSVHDISIQSLAQTPDILEGEVTPSSSPEYKMTEDKSESRHLRFQFSSTSCDESHNSSIEESFVDTSFVSDVVDSPASTNSSSVRMIEEPHASPRRPLYSKQHSSSFEDSFPKPKDNLTAPVKEDLSDNSNSSQATEEYELCEDNGMLVDEEDEEVDNVYTVSYQRENDSDSDISTDENPASMQSTSSPSKSKSSAVLQLRAAKGSGLVVQDASSDTSMSEEENVLSKEPLRAVSVPLINLKKTALRSASSSRSMSFFSAERGKEHFMQMKSAMSKELAKQSGEASFDFNNADLEIVETESPLASLVNKTLDSVFSTRSNLPSIMPSKSKTLSAMNWSTSKTTPLPSAKDKKLLAPLSVDVIDIASASPALAPQSSPKTRSQAARENEAMLLECSSLRRSMRKSSSLSPKTLNTSPPVSTLAKSGQGSPGKSSKSKISTTLTKSSVVQTSEPSQQEVIPILKTRKSLSFSPKSASEMSSASSIPKSEIATDSTAMSPKETALQIGAAKLEISSISVSKKSPSSQRLCGQQNESLSIRKTPTSSHNISPSTKGQNSSDNSGGDLELSVSPLLTFSKVEIKTSEDDLASPLAPVLHTQSTPELNFDRAAAHISPTLSRSSPTLSLQNVHESVGESVVHLLYSPLAEASPLTSLTLEPKTFNEESTEMQVLEDDWTTEPKDVLPLACPVEQFEMETASEVIVSLPVHPAKHQGQADYEMAPDYDEMELSTKMKEIQTPEPHVATQNALDFLQLPSRLVQGSNTCDQNTSTTTLNFSTQVLVTELEIDASSAEAQVDENSSTAQLNSQTPYGEQTQIVASTEIQTEPMTSMETSPQTKSHSEHADVSRLHLKKSPEVENKLLVEDIESKAEIEVGTSTGTPFTIRTRSQSGQNSYNLRTKQAPKSTVTMKSSSKIFDSPQKGSPQKSPKDLKQDSEVPLKSGCRVLHFKDSPAVSTTFRRVRRSSQSTLDPSNAVETVPLEKSFKLRSGTQLSTELCDRVDQTNIIVEEVTEIPDEIISTLTSTELHSKAGVETPVKAQEKSKRTPRRKRAIKTTFINDDDQLSNECCESVGQISMIVEEEENLEINATTTSMEPQSVAGVETSTKPQEKPTRTSRRSAMKTSFQIDNDQISKDEIVEEINMIVEEEVTENPEEVISTSKSMPSQSEAGQEISTKPQEKPTRTSRRSTIQTSFINIDDQLSKGCGKTVDETNMIVEDEGNPNEGIFTPKSTETQSEAGMETPAKKQEKPRKMPRRKAIKTTFINEDESVKSAEPTIRKSERKTRFSFSQPLIVEAEETDYTLLQTPPPSTASFIFSPPLTRSKSRKPRKSTEDTSEGPLEEAGASGTSRLVSNTTRTPKESGRRKSRSQSFSDTPISFISPFLETSEQAGNSSNNTTHSLRSSRILHRHSMTLRKQKGFLVTRKSARLD